MDEHSYTKNEISNTSVENLSRNFCQKNTEPQKKTIRQRQE